MAPPWSEKRAESMATLAMDKVKDEYAKPAGRRSLANLIDAYALFYAAYYIAVAVRDEKLEGGIRHAMTWVVQAIGRECRISTRMKPPPLTQPNPRTITVNQATAQRMLTDAALAVERLRRVQMPLIDKLPELLTAIGVAHIASAAEADRDNLNAMFQSVEIKKDALAILEKDCRASIQQYASKRRKKKKR